MISQLSRLNVIVEALPPPRFSWYANGKPIQQSQRFKVTYDETGLVTLIIFNAQQTDSGEYEFVAANEVGQISCKTVLNIQRKGNSSIYTCTGRYIANIVSVKI